MVGNAGIWDSQENSETNKININFRKMMLGAGRDQLLNLILSNGLANRSFMAYNFPGYVHCRAGQNFWSLNFQTPSLSLVQHMNVFQVWGP